MLVRSARVAHGWTQRDLANRLHCSRSTVSRLETGAKLWTTLPPFAASPRF
ncbi:helix-turn-helix transcriptional regulator [Actinomadura sp. 1N219]|uniref:helix-turn-helix transcriptional regulator n=1 Tax=Actinomadura sp. 1N219 TaxID=3375152 RepID=UPI0037A07A92